MAQLFFSAAAQREIFRCLELEGHPPQMSNEIISRMSLTSSFIYAKLSLLLLFSYHSSQSKLSLLFSNILFKIKEGEISMQSVLCVYVCCTIPEEYILYKFIPLNLIRKEMMKIFIKLRYSQKIIIVSKQIKNFNFDTRTSVIGNFHLKNFLTFHISHKVFMFAKNLLPGGEIESW
jgi:hypothetical protein